MNVIVLDLGIHNLSILYSFVKRNNKNKNKKSQGKKGVRNELSPTLKFDLQICWELGPIVINSKKVI